MMRMGRRRGPSLLATAVVVGAVSSTAAKKGAQQGAAAQQQADAQQQAAQQASPAPAGTDINTQIQQLAQMHNAGVLTDAEFAAAKAKLLA